MDSFLELVGNLSVGWIVTVVLAGAFLVKVYKKIESYFSERALSEKSKDDEIKAVIDQAKQYPIWRQQSLEIQQRFAKSIEGLHEGQQHMMSRIEEIEKERRDVKKNELRDRLLQQHRYFTSHDKNPMQAWSEMEAKAFWDTFGDYEALHGNGHMQEEVKPAMQKLEEIPMCEQGKIVELMHSRR